MIVKRILISDMEGKEVKTIENGRIFSYEEQLHIESLVIHDYRFRQIARDLIKFSGYMHMHEGEGVKRVEVFLWF